MMLALFVIELVHQANAGERCTPQDWLTNNFERCYNTSKALCRSDPAKLVQPCTMWNRNGSYSEGIVVKVSSDSGYKDIPSIGSFIVKVSGN